MNQGRIWCVVHPTVGLPLLLGSVTTIALLVHASVLSNTTWMAKYWQGGAEATVAEATTRPSVTAPTNPAPADTVAQSAAPAMVADAGTSPAPRVAPADPPKQ